MSDDDLMTALIVRSDYERHISPALCKLLRQASNRIGEIDAKDAEIALLKARIAKLEPALEVFADPTNYLDHCRHCGHPEHRWDHEDQRFPDPAAFAREALNP